MIRRRGRRRRRRRRICRRMGPRNSSGLKPIIFRFKSHKKKTELHKARKYLKSVSLNQYFHDTNKICICINENLTYSRRKLFAKVRKFNKDSHWHSAWTLDSKMFIEKSQEEQLFTFFALHLATFFSLKFTFSYLISGENGKRASLFL